MDTVISIVVCIAVAYMLISILVTLAYAVWTDGKRDDYDPEPVEFGLAWGLNLTIFIVRLLSRKRLHRK